MSRILPQNNDEQFQKLAENDEVNRNWLEYEAYKAGVDFDHIRGYDEGEPPKKFQADDWDYYESYKENNG